MLSPRPETFGNVIVVNGSAWPYLDVEPRKYRFRLLNGSDSRFYNLWLEEAGVGQLPGLVMHQIGTEGGLLPETVDLGGSSSAGLLLANGERADVIVDFSAFAGKTILMRNDAAAPFPSGDAPDANTTGKIMVFRVKKPLNGTDSSTIPAHPLPVTPLGAPALTRTLDLQELTDIYYTNDTGVVAKRLELRLNSLRYHDPITETPRLNTIEDWIMVNTTSDVHPMHLHLVRFQVLEKGSYDSTLYTPAAGGLMGVLGNGALHPDVDPAGHRDSDPGFDPSYTVADNEKAFKDTVKVPPGGYVRIRAKFDRLGQYVWHCHILSHEEHSMMRPFLVVP
jgi:spore coat protein A